MKSRYQSFIAAVVALTSISCVSTAPDRFVRTDINHDGKLSRDEINSYLVAELFEARDANHDQQIAETEWVVGRDRAQKEQFRKCDTNRDGVVTRQEAETFGRRNGSANLVVREADKDKDGVVSRAEITAYYGSKEGKPR